MRAVIPVHTDAPAAEVDNILSAHDWMIHGAPQDPVERKEFWLSEVNKGHSQAILATQQATLADQISVKSRSEAEDLPKSEGDISVQQDALTSKRSARDALADRGDDVSERTLASTLLPLPALVEIAGIEAHKILEVIGSYDKPLAYMTFQYPIVDRVTQTFGTVHYEPTNHHITVRLSNTHSERLKVATERLVRDLVDNTPIRRTARLMNAFSGLRNGLKTMLHRGLSRRRRPIVFARIKVLESSQSEEVLSGRVVLGKTFDSQLKECRSDTIVASVFLCLGIVAFTSSLLIHFGSWTNGWLASVFDSLSRIGTLFLAASLGSIMNILLRWRLARQKPSIAWSFDVAPAEFLAARQAGQEPKVPNRDQEIEEGYRQERKPLESSSSNQWHSRFQGLLKDLAGSMYLTDAIDVLRKRPDDLEQEAWKIIESELGRGYTALGPPPGLTEDLLREGPDGRRG